MIQDLVKRESKVKDLTTRSTLDLTNNVEEKDNSPSDIAQTKTPMFYEDLPISNIMQQYEEVLSQGKKQSPSHSEITQ